MSAGISRTPVVAPRPGPDATPALDGPDFTGRTDLEGWWVFTTNHVIFGGTGHISFDEAGRMGAALLALANQGKAATSREDAHRSYIVACAAALAEAGVPVCSSDAEYDDVRIGWITPADPATPDRDPTGELGALTFAWSEERGWGWGRVNASGGLEPVRNFGHCVLPAPGEFAAVARRIVQGERLAPLGGRYRDAADEDGFEDELAAYAQTGGDTNA